MELSRNDLSFAVMRLPSALKKIMKHPDWQGLIFVGGGYLRSIITGDKLNDIDIFVPSRTHAELLANKLVKESRVISTGNAFTIREGNNVYQIIHRWTFNNIEDVANSFDFTVCCAAFTYSDDKWMSYCDDNYYQDLAGKRLIYRSPERNEDAGGSVLRVLKYYQKGYRIPLDSLAAVIARYIKDVDIPLTDEIAVTEVLKERLYSVDPQLDPLHEAHLPSNKDMEVD